jgi:methionyl-tRNA formyltransferase
MDAEMDHGPIAAVEHLTPGTGKLADWPIRFHEYETITAQIGAELLAKILPSIEVGTHEFTRQDHDQATNTKKFKKEDGYIEMLSSLKNFDISSGVVPLEIYLRFCALEEWPGAYFFAIKDGKTLRIKITDMSWHKNAHQAEITKVIPEGKKEMTWKDFVHFISGK